MTTSRSERYLGYAGNGYAAGEGSSGVTELREDEVWSMVDDGGDRNDSMGNNSEWSSSENNGGTTTATARRNRRVSRGDRHVGGLSLAFEEDSLTASPRIVHQVRGHEGGVTVTPRGHHMATSAPVNVPDWSKIYRVESVESIHDSDDGWDDDNNGDDSEMVPPHEYLARSRKSNGNSVFEGVGRTLKGRDMRRVRDAVWSQTGFDG